MYLRLTAIRATIIYTVGKNNNIIHINGKRYDATTGAALSMDGVISDSTKPLQPVALAKQPLVSIVSTQPTMSDFVRTPANHTVKHQVQGSQTLMRHAVKKPAASSHIRAHSHAGAVASQPSIVVTLKSSAHALDHRKVNHAAKVTKHHHVQKFATLTPSNPALLAGPLQHSVRPIATKTVTKAPRTTADMLQSALEHARSHEQTFTPSSRFGASRRVISMVIASSALLLIAVLAGLNSVNAVKLHVASSKAGFPVAMPNYQPAGFSLGGLSYNPGNANLNFKSNSDNRAFSITEKTSQWDSNTLREMVVAPTDKNYQTIESAGRTIYVDNNHTANWVNAGVWYQVKNENALSDHQLVQIANSL